MSKKVFLVGLSLILIGLVTIGCTRVISVRINPSSALIEGGETVNFAASDYKGDPATVNWSVVSGPGTITSVGLYTAPASVSSVTNVTIRATLASDSSVTSSATVIIRPPVQSEIVDGLGDAAIYDIRSIKTSRTSTTLTVTITFDTATPPNLPPAGSVVGAGDLAGFIDFDTDQAVGTGIPSPNSFYCFGSTSSAIGVDFFISLFYRNPAGNYDIIETVGFTDVGDAIPNLMGNVLELTIPLADLGGDDGKTNMNTVQGDDVGPTDCVPDTTSAVVTSEDQRKRVEVAIDDNPYTSFLMARYGITWEVMLVFIVERSSKP